MESGVYAFRNVPRSSSSNACRSCSCVFMTIGPYHATGSSMRLAGDQQEPDPVFAGLHRRLRRLGRTEPANGCPLRREVRCPAIRRFGRHGQRTGCVAELAAPGKHISESVARRLDRQRFPPPGGTDTSRYIGSAAIPSTAPLLPQKLPHTTRTWVPSSSVTSGMSGAFTSW